MIKKNVTPFNHQKEGVTKFVDADFSHAFYWDVGVGKTLGALMCFDYMKYIGKAEQMLVVAPISLLDKAWGEDIHKFTDMDYTNFNKKNNITDDICVINLQSLISKKKLPKVIEWAKKAKTMCVIDESSKIKNYKAKSTKTVLDIRSLFTGKLVLSGTPAPNDESEYHSQMCFLSDKIFNPNFFGFRHRYFTLSRGDFQFPSKGLSKSELGALMKKGFKYRLLRDKREEFYSRMNPYVSWIKKEEVLDLPDQIDETRAVILGKDQRIVYNQMKQHLITEISGEDVVATVALAKLTRLRQIVSGFSKSDEGNIVSLDQNPKLRELEDTITEIGDHQVLIFAEYHKEIDDIKGLLGDQAAILDGRTKDKAEVIGLFKENKVKYLIAHPLSAGVGLSFNACDYCIFYSMSYSSENYYQCKGRIHRANKKNNATYIHLVAENTIDEIIFKCVKDKKDKMDIIKEFLK